MFCSFGIVWLGLSCWYALFGPWQGNFVFHMQGSTEVTVDVMSMNSITRTVVQ